MNVFRNYVFYALLLVLSFSVSCTHEGERNDLVLRNAVKDVDGNKYDAVKIGKQVWMKSNLRTTHFRDKSPVPQGDIFYQNKTDPRFFKPNTQTFPIYNEERDGLYYNWPAVVDERGLCPKGWHVPDDDDWLELREYVGKKTELVYGTDYRNIAKALASQAGWEESDVEGSPGCHPEENNATNLSLTPTGYLAWEDDPSNYGSEAAYWTATESPVAQNISGQIYKDWGYVNNIYSVLPRIRTSNSAKYAGHPVRCIKD